MKRPLVKAKRKATPIKALEGSADFIRRVAVGPVRSSNNIVWGRSLSAPVRVAR